MHAAEQPAELGKQARIFARTSPRNVIGSSALQKIAFLPSIPQIATKPAIALQQIRKAVEEQVATAAVLADAATYGNDNRFRED